MRVHRWFYRRLEFEWMNQPRDGGGAERWSVGDARGVRLGLGANYKRHCSVCTIHSATTHDLNTTNIRSNFIWHGCIIVYVSPCVCLAPSLVFLCEVSQSPPC